MFKNLNKQTLFRSFLTGDSTQVKIYYKPVAHGKQKEKRLDITRTVSIFSNDPVDFEQKLKINLTQLP